MANITPGAQLPLESFAGNQLGDNARFGNIFDYDATVFLPYADPADPATTGPAYRVTSNSIPGVLNAGSWTMDLQPILEPGLADNGVSASLVAVQAIASAGALPLRGLPTGATYSGFNLIMNRSIPMIQLNVSRSLLLAVNGSGGTPSLPFNISVSGIDRYGQRLTVTQSIGAGITSFRYYDLGKALWAISSANVTSGTGAPIWLGLGATFDLTYYTPRNGLLNNVSYGPTNAQVSLNFNDPATTATYVYKAPPSFLVAPTATSTDVRGSITLDPTNVSGGTGQIGANIVSTNWLTINMSIYANLPNVAYQNYVGQNLASSIGQWVATPINTRSSVYPFISRTESVVGMPQFYNASLAQ